MSNNTLAAHEIALTAILVEAKKLGYDIEGICTAATTNMHGAAYRGGTATVVPAIDAINEALTNARLY
ncbi:hypothetical protein [Undibacterium sp.]|uniref:hypothetical protein n=1 Tax=Undibacterium sp. TaxID=1914977 RepID=UPI0037502498